MTYNGVPEYFKKEKPETAKCLHVMIFPNDISSVALSTDGGRTQYRRGGCELCGEVLVEQTVDNEGVRKHVAFYQRT
jgi:hypothetical protein